MKKKLFAALMAFVILAGMLFVGCNQSKMAEPKEVIGIIGAMDVELDSLKEAMDIMNTSTEDAMEFYEGILEDQKVVIVKCGMGKVNAGVCASVLIDDFGCTKIINTGVAGSLDNKLNIGDIVVSTDAVQHDFDVEHIGFKKGEIPYTGMYAFPADEKLREQAVEAVKEVAADIDVYEGRICSGDQFIHTKEQKDKILGDFGGMCAEMEGAAIAQICYLNEIPFVIIRAVSDKVDETEAVEYKEFEPVAAARSADVVIRMLDSMDED